MPDQFPENPSDADATRFPDPFTVPVNATGIGRVVLDAFIVTCARTSLELAAPVTVEPVLKLNDDPPRSNSPDATFNDPERNGFFKLPPEIEFRSSQ